MPMLVVRRRCEERLRAAWPGFLERRLQRLAQQERYGTAAEKVAEGIMEDLLTAVLDWPMTSLNYQVGRSDILLTQQGIRYLIVETKRPGALLGRPSAVEKAVNQARRYADEQKVRRIAVSDGTLVAAWDLDHSEPRLRLSARLDMREPPLDLWWVSVQGIYRPMTDPVEPIEPCGAEPRPDTDDPSGTLLHSKYKLPAACFAYVGDINKPATWRLPYLRADRSIDTARLPKAIQAILSNYRGLRVSTIPEKAMPDTLVRLALAAAELGRLPPTCTDPAPIYRQLHDALDQLGRLADVIPTATAG
jgi:hypothetical protein